MMKVLTRFSALVIFASASLFAYWAFIDDPEVMEIKSQMVMNSGDIHPGGHVDIKTKMCVKRLPVPNSAVRTITNGFVYTLDTAQLVYNGIGCTEVDRQYSIPPAATFGRHHYQNCVSYQVNPVRQKRVCTAPLEFDVIAP